MLFNPVLIAVTVMLMVLIWRRGWLARAGLIPLVAIQIVWAADAPFQQSSSRIQSGMQLIRSGHEGKSASRFDAYRKPFRDIERALPADAVVLLHTVHVSLGIDRRKLLDWLGFQGLIDYRPMRTPREVHERLVELGVTHILSGWTRPRTWQEAVLFDSYLHRHTTPLGSFGPYKLWGMPSEPPPREPPYKAIVLGTRYTDGLYPVEALSVVEDLPAEYHRWPAPQAPIDKQHELGSLLPAADVVVVSKRSRHARAAGKQLAGVLSHAFHWQGFDVYVREQPRLLPLTASPSLP
jgi:hypothetical protein